MRFDELVERFKKQDPNDAIFNFMLNQVADYTMNEQTIIKKDNKTNDVDTIKYRYDENTYRYINEFFQKLNFYQLPKLEEEKNQL